MKVKIIKILMAILIVCTYVFGMILVNDQKVIMELDRKWKKGLESEMVQRGKSWRIDENGFIELIGDNWEEAIIELEIEIRITDEIVK